MKNKILLTIIAFLLIVVFLGSRSNTTSFNEEENSSENAETKISMFDPKTSSIENLELEEYVIGVIAAEMPASFSFEALKAQAVASRTYALYKMLHTNGDYDIYAGVSNQAYNTIDEMQEKWQDKFQYYYDRIKNAVEETKGIVITYKSEPIIAYYFAISNGKTEDSLSVFGTPQDYLTSVESNWDKSVNKYEVTNIFTKKDFCQKLAITCNTIDIKDIVYSSSGRVDSLTINDKYFKGTQVRKLLGLRSTDFKIDIKDNVTITTKGYGHGVGMSQYGANAMANLGYTYEEILKHYYQNIELEKI